MEIQKHRKWMILGIILLLVVAVAAGTADVWKNASTDTGKKGYVAVIRIDGPIYGGPDTESVLTGNSGVTSEEKRSPSAGISIKPAPCAAAMSAGSRSSGLTGIHLSSLSSWDGMMTLIFFSVLLGMMFTAFLDTRSRTAQFAIAN